jgi:hypothetical protein
LGLKIFADRIKLELEKNGIGSEARFEICCSDHCSDRIELAQNLRGICLAWVDHTKKISLAWLDSTKKFVGLALLFHDQNF